MRRRRLPTLNRLAALVACLLAASVVACGHGPVLGVAEEYPPTNEAATTARLIELTKRALEERHPEGQTLRFNQPRHPGCVEARFEIDSGLEPELAVGLFARSASYRTLIRFANAKSESDTKKDFRGMSLKLLGVPGEMLFGDASNFDIVLNSHPVMLFATPREFADFIESPVRFFATHPRALWTALTKREHHASHLTIAYWSTTPYLFGVDQAVKYKVEPCDGAKGPIDEPTEGYLRAAMRKHLEEGEACFDFMVQFQTDPATMPIEDASVEWKSEPRKVATITIPSQSIDSPERMERCEELAFNPWRVTAEHRPLGGMNRVRRELYDELAAFRHGRNNVSYREPTADEPF